MKRIAFVAVLFVFGLAMAGTFHSADGNFTLTFGGMLSNQLSAQDIRFKLSGGVVATSKTDAVRFASDRAVCLVKSLKGVTQLQSIQGDGHVKITKTSTTNGVARITDLTSTTGDYVTLPSPVAHAKGNVRIVDHANVNRQEVIATGEEATATFKAGKTTGTGELETAILTGKVRIDASQVNPRGEPSKLNAVGDSVTLDYTRPEPTITLRGHVKLKYKQGTMDGELEENTVVLTLDRKGQVTSFKAGSTK